MVGGPQESSLSLPHLPSSLSLPLSLYLSPSLLPFFHFFLSPHTDMVTMFTQNRWQMKMLIWEIVLTSLWEKKMFEQLLIYGARHFDAFCHKAE